jgi:hypothetical protein
MFTDVPEVLVASRNITLVKEAAGISETSVIFYETTWRYCPKGSHLHTCRRENLKSCLNKFLSHFSAIFGVNVIEILRKITAPSSVKEQLLPKHLLRPLSFPYCNTPRIKVSLKPLICSSIKDSNSLMEKAIKN